MNTTQLFTRISLTSLTCLLIVAMWSFIFAWRNQAFNRDSLLAFIATHIVLALQLLVLLMLWFQNALSRPMISLTYAVVSLVTIPCVWFYLPKKTPRQHSSNLTLACLFAAGMVLRTLQTTQEVL